MTMTGDMQLKEHVEDELSWEPSINATTIGVGVKDAVVTLSGHVGSLTEKLASERAVLRIHGVRALANELEVTYPGDSQRTDEDIARAAAFALFLNSLVPEDRIKIQVSRGWVTLQGAVDHEYQRRAAARAIEFLAGVTGVSNLVEVKATRVGVEVKSQIEAALKRNASVEAQNIAVFIQGDKVILSGHVSSLIERFAAERAAWRAPGVSWVENNIIVKAPMKKAAAA